MAIAANSKPMASAVGSKKARAYSATPRKLAYTKRLSRSHRTSKRAHRNTKAGVTVLSIGKKNSLAGTKRYRTNEDSATDGSANQSRTKRYMNTPPRFESTTTSQARTTGRF